MPIVNVWMRCWCVVARLLRHNYVRFWLHGKHTLDSILWFVIRGIECQFENFDIIVLSFVRLPAQPQCHCIAERYYSAESKWLHINSEYITAARTCVCVWAALAIIICQQSMIIYYIIPQNDRWAQYARARSNAWNAIFGRAMPSAQALNMNWNENNKLPIDKFMSGKPNPLYIYPRRTMTEQNRIQKTALELHNQKCSIYPPLFVGF